MSPSWSGCNRLNNKGVVPALSRDPSPQKSMIARGHVDGESSADIFSTLGGLIRNVWYRALIGTTFPSRIWEGHVMGLPSSFIAPSAVAVLSTVLLFGPAASQTATDSAKPLPRITVEAPKPVARPDSPRQVANTGASRRRSSATQTASSTARTPAPDSILGRIAKLEKVASNCNGGCESSLRHGKDPWVGCSESGGGLTTAPFSATCRDNLTYKSYVDCVETKLFLGEYRNRAWWVCSSLDAAGKFQVAELKRSRHPR
jgi:hypothetical protein